MTMFYHKRKSEKVYVEKRKWPINGKIKEKSYTSAENPVIYMTNRHTK